MSIEVQGSVGSQSPSAGDGTILSLRLGRTGDTVVSELHGRYFEQMRSGRMFSAANQAAQAVSVALATSYTGLLLYNPPNSGRIIVPNLLKYAISVAPAAIATIGLLGGYSGTGGVTVQTTALTVQSNQIGNSSKGVGVALSAATIVTPTYIVELLDGFTAAALSAPTPVVDLGGAFGILPGGFLAFSALTAVTGYGFMTWEEVDLPL